MFRVRFCGGRNLLLPLFFTLLIPLAGGCGYRFPIPPPSGKGGKSVAVTLFTNHSVRPMTDQIVTRRLMDRLSRSGYRLVDAAEADLLVDGVVESVTPATVARTAADAGVVSRMNATVTVTVKKREGTILFTERLTDSVFLPQPASNTDRLFVEESGIGELSDRLALRVVRRIHAEVSGRTE